MQNLPERGRSLPARVVVAPARGPVQLERSGNDPAQRLVRSGQRFNVHV